MSPFDLTWFLHRLSSMLIRMAVGLLLLRNPSLPCPALSWPHAHDQASCKSSSSSWTIALLLVLCIICVNCDRPWQNIKECKAFAPVDLRTSLCCLPTCLHLLTLRISEYASL